MPKTVSIEVKGLKLVALGVEYWPGAPATWQDPPDPEYAEWDMVYIESDAGKNDLTPYLTTAMQDAIDEELCAYFRSE